MKKLYLVIVGLFCCCKVMAFELQSHSFKPFSVLGMDFICLQQSGNNISPALNWTSPPKEAQSFLLFVHDPDAPNPRGYSHWVVYIDNPQITAFHEGLAPKENPNVVFGLNGRDENAYVGACPPQGSGIHRYNFTLYALNSKLDKEIIKKSHQLELINLYSDKIIGQAVLTGFYKHKAEL